MRRFPRREVTSGGRAASLGLLLLAVAAAGCTGGDLADTDLTAATTAPATDGAPGLFESWTGIVDDVTYESLFDMAEASDLAFDGWLVDVDEGYVVDATDRTDESRFLELIVDRATADPPIRLLWPYPVGYPLDAVRSALPLGSRMVVYVDRVVVPAADRARWHHAPVDGDDPDDDPSDPDAGHEHWRPVTISGVFVGDPVEPHVDRAAGVSFTDAPADDAPIDDWLVILVPFDDASLQGTCSDVEFEFVDDEASEFDDPDDAADALIATEPALEGLTASDGQILLRGVPVGTYRITERPDDTFAVEYAEWCHPEH